MIQMFLLYLYFCLILINTRFAMDISETSAVRELLYPILEETQCGCIVVVSTSDNSAGELKYLENLAYLMMLHIRIEGNNYLTAFLTIDDFSKQYATPESLVTGTCFKPLAILISTAATKYQLEKFYKEAGSVRMIWLVFTNENHLKEYFSDIKLLINNGVIFATTDSQSNTVFRVIYAVGPNMENKIQKAGEYNDTIGLILYEDTWISRRSDLQGLNFHVGIIEIAPWVFFDSYEDGQPISLKGIYGQIWDELKLIFNLTSTYYIEKERKVGVKNEDGEWGGMIGNITRKEIDALLCDVDYTSTRVQVLEYMYPLANQKLQIYYRTTEGRQSDWRAVLKPFHIDVWLAIAVWIASVSILYRVADKIAGAYNIEGCGLTTLTDCFFFALQSLSSQGASIHQIPKLWAHRFTFLSCYLLSTVILPAFSAYLVSAITWNEPYKKFDSLDDLLRSNIPLLLGKETSAYEFFENHRNNELLKNVFEKLVKPYMELPVNENYLKALAEVCTKTDVALMTTELDVRQKMYDDPNCKLTKFTHFLGDSIGSIALPKRSPYTHIFNFQLMRMAEVGCLRKHQLFYYHYPSRHKEALFEPVLLIQVDEVFLFLLTAILLSVLILCLEIIVYRRQCRNEKKHALNEK